MGLQVLIALYGIAPLVGGFSMPVGGDATHLLMIAAVMVRFAPLFSAGLFK